MKIETCFSSQSIVAPLKNGECTTVHHVALKSTIQDPSNIWHLRYGHLGYAGLSLLSKNKMIDGLPRIVEPIVKFEACILGKQHRKPFQSGNSTMARAPLELVHMDLVGPMQIISVGKSRFFMTFIND